MKRYLTWKGRMKRTEFFIAMALAFVVCIVIIFACSPFYPPFKVQGMVTSSIIEDRENLYNIIMLPFAYLTVCWVIKRFHDMDKSGLYYLILLVPIVNIYFIFVLLFKKGTIEINKYDEVYVEVAD